MQKMINIWAVGSEIANLIEEINSDKKLKRKTNYLVKIQNFNINFYFFSIFIPYKL